MIRLHLRSRSSCWFAFLSLCTLLAPPLARADVIISNLGQFDSGFYGSEQNVGLAVLIANTAINVTSIEMVQNTAGTTPDETFAIYTRNADGTLGTLVTQNFNMSIPAGSGVASGSPVSPLVLAPNTGYWLLMVSGPSDTIGVDFTQSTSYSSQSGVAMATDNHALTDKPQGATSQEYVSASAGPPLFQIDGTAVPEPSSLALLGMASVAGLLRSRARRRI